MSKEYAPIRVVVVTVSFLLVCLPCLAQSDWHETSVGACVKSSFAHGYMHGYEEGFHVGDLDIQMGRTFRDVKNHEQFKRTAGYRTTFGERTSYEGGFRSGYLVGYTDAYAGRTFRAIRWARMTSRPSAGEKIQWSRGFDSAFREGYFSGQKKGLEDGRSAAAEDSVVACNEQQHQAKGGASDAHPEYCEAFTSGYQLGYSDGYSNQRAVVARK